MKKYIVYHIINKLNNMIYIGVHVTENINDSYMGSGTNIRKAIGKFGMENFEKIILFQFDNETDMLDKERELVNEEFIARPDTYNIIMGGGNFLTLDTVTVKDENNNYSRVHKTDPRYISGELKFLHTGFVVVKDKNNKTCMMNLDDPRYLSGEFVPINKNMVNIKDEFGKKYQVKYDNIKYLSGELVGINKDKYLVKDKFNNVLLININDPRYLSGELKSFWLDKKHNKITKEKIGKANSISQKGWKNSQFGTCWIFNDKESIKIKKEELEKYLKMNWKKGRKIKF